MPFRAVSRETSTPFGAVFHSNRCSRRCPLESPRALHIAGACASGARAARGSSQTLHTSSIRRFHPLAWCSFAVTSRPPHIGGRLHRAVLRAGELGPIERHRVSAIEHAWRLGFGPGSSPSCRARHRYCVLLPGAPSLFHVKHAGQVGAFKTRVGDARADRLPPREVESRRSRRSMSRVEAAQPTRSTLESHLVGWRSIHTGSMPFDSHDRSVSRSELKGARRDRIGHRRRLDSTPCPTRRPCCSPREGLPSRPHPRAPHRWSTVRSPYRRRSTPAPPGPARRWTCRRRTSP